LAGFILEISGNFPVKARKFLFKLFVIDWVDKNV
jgi:hypothetical protein